MVERYPDPVGEFAPARDVRRELDAVGHLRTIPDGPVRLELEDGKTAGGETGRCMGVQCPMLRRVAPYGWGAVARLGYSRL